jgi:hypothetical protein
MKEPRFGSTMRFVLNRVGEGLMWLGLAMAPAGEMSHTAMTEIARARREARPRNQPSNAPEDPDQPVTTTLSRAERTEWATLVKRLE